MKKARRERIQISGVVKWEMREGHIDYKSIRI